MARRNTGCRPGDLITEQSGETVDFTGTESLAYEKGTLLPFVHIGLEKSSGCDFRARAADESADEDESNRRMT